MMVLEATVIAGELVRKYISVKAELQLKPTGRRWIFFEKSRKSATSN